MRFSEEPGDPSTITIERPELDNEIKTMPLFRILLHNDDVNSMEHVVAALQHVFKFEQQQCIVIMLEAHKSGVALCKTEPKEHAEMHQEMLTSLSITATIEPDA